MNNISLEDRQLWKVNNDKHKRLAIFDNEMYISSLDDPNAYQARQRESPTIGGKLWIIKQQKKKS